MTLIWNLHISWKRHCLCWKPKTCFFCRYRHFDMTLKMISAEFGIYIELYFTDTPSLPNAPQIERVQDRAQRELANHVRQTHPSNPDRLAKLLLRLPALHSLSPSVMEELFFAGLIGSVQIDSIIPYILRMETAEYNSQMAGQGLQGAAEGTGLDSTPTGSMLFASPQITTAQMTSEGISALQTSIATT